MNHLLTISNIVNAIYIIEGGTNTSHPYGIMLHTDATHSARQVCVCTINHIASDYTVRHLPTYIRQSTSISNIKYRHNESNVIEVDIDFINYMADRYCPPSCDAIGNKRWKYNMEQLLRI